MIHHQLNQAEVGLATRNPTAHGVTSDYAALGDADTRSVGAGA